MYIFPAIDLMEGCAVRLVRGDYAQKTVYSKDPAAVARSFAEAGAEFLHVVDLEGAKDGTTPNLETIRQIVASSGLKTEVGGGIRSEETIRTYLAAGVYRVILGTAALTEPDFLSRMVATYPEQIAVGVDIKDGKVAIKGWTEVSEMGLDPFCQTLEQLGVQTVICTDISKDGLLSGTNLELYRHLSKTYRMNIVAPGGISSLADVAALRKMGLYGAILGKALYTGHLDLAQAIRMGKEENP